MVLRLDEAGADALVLFNRYLQPEIDLDKLTVGSPRRSLKHPAVRPAAASVDRAAPRTGERFARCDDGRRDAWPTLRRTLLAGADAVMTASALLSTVLSTP